MASEAVLYVCIIDDTCLFFTISMIILIILMLGGYSMECD
jgi:hypothetical protein